MCWAVLAGVCCVVANPVAAQSEVVLYAWEPIQSERILPSSPPPQKYEEKIEVVATPGEVEPASFVIYSEQSASDIRIKMTPLRHRSTEVKLPASVVGIRVVKAWFQAGDSFWMRKGKRKLLTPELLLLDDDLIRVSTDRQIQWIRTQRGSGVSYEDISSSHRSLPENVEIHDAKTLRPFNMMAKESKQIWLTLRVPEDAVPGDYSGSLTVEGAGLERRSIAVELKVLPFVLDSPRVETSLYYRGRLADRTAKVRGWNVKTPAAYAIDMKNLVDHGILNPTITHYGSPSPHDHLVSELEFRQAAGMTRGAVYLNGYKLGRPATEAELQALESRVRHWIDWFAGRGYGPVYFYGEDEAKVDQLQSQRPGWRRVQRVGGKVFAACYVGTAEKVGRDLDLPVVGRALSESEAERFHAVGKRIFSYGNPQVGLEDPLVYRQNYGFLLWKAGYDGSMTYAYQHAYGDIWNDFDGDRVYRDLVFAYPTDSGVIDTIQWEGMREAVDDLRYLATLQNRIEKVRSPRGREAAERWLRDLDVSRLPHEVRRSLIEKIIELDGD